MIISNLLPTSHAARFGCSLLHVAPFQEVVEFIAHCVSKLCVISHRLPVAPKAGVFVRVPRDEQATRSDGRCGRAIMVHVEADRPSDPCFDKGGLGPLGEDALAAGQGSQGP
jgi:hypothetical protein